MGTWMFWLNCSTLNTVRLNRSPTERFGFWRICGQWDIVSRSLKLYFRCLKISWKCSTVCLIERGTFAPNWKRTCNQFSWYWLRSRGSCASKSKLNIKNSLWTMLFTNYNGKHFKIIVKFWNVCLNLVSYSKSSMNFNLRTYMKIWHALKHWKCTKILVGFQ